MKDLPIYSQNFAFSTASASFSEIVKGGKREYFYWRNLILSSLNFIGSSALSQALTVGPSATNWDREYYFNLLPWF